MVLFDMFENFRLGRCVISVVSPFDPGSRDYCTLCGKVINHGTTPRGAPTFGATQTQVHILSRQHTAAVDDLSEGRLKLFRGPLRPERPSYCDAEGPQYQDALWSGGHPGLDENQCVERARRLQRLLQAEHADDFGIRFSRKEQKAGRRSPGRSGRCPYYAYDHPYSRAGRYPINPLLIRNDD